MSYLQTSLLAIILLLSIMPAAAKEVSKYEVAEKKLSEAEAQMKNYFAEKEKKECEVPCGFVKKFEEAQASWKSWVENEFAYENYQAANGTLVANMMSEFKARKMEERAKKIKKDLAIFKKENS